MRNTAPLIVTTAIWLASTTVVLADEFEEVVTERTRLLESTDYTRLGTCQDLMREIYRWGILDQTATGIAFGVTENMAKMVKRAEAIENHQLRRGSAGFLIGFCTAIMHIHMANRDGAETLTDLPEEIHVRGPVLQARTARLQDEDTFNTDYCRGHMGKLRDANVIDEAAHVMLHSKLDNAIQRQGVSGTPRQDISQGFVYGLCSAVLNAMMGAVR